MGRWVRQVSLAEAQNWRCAYCGGRMSWLRPGPCQVTREHVVPRSRGGGDEIENLVAACKACNEARNSDLDPYAFAEVRRAMVEADEWPPVSDPTPLALVRLFQWRRENHRRRRAEQRDQRRHRERALRKVRHQAARDERDWNAGFDFD